MSRVDIKALYRLRSVLFVLSFPFCLSSIRLQQGHMSEIFYVKKNPFFKFKVLSLSYLIFIFNCFNSQVNNLYAMEREQFFFIDIK